MSTYDRVWLILFRCGAQPAQPASSADVRGTHLSVLCEMLRKVRHGCDGWWPKLLIALPFVSAPALYVACASMKSIRVSPATTTTTARRKLGLLLSPNGSRAMDRRYRTTLGSCFHHCGTQNMAMRGFMFPQHEAYVRGRSLYMFDVCYSKVMLNENDQQARYLSGVEPCA